MKISPLLLLLLGPQLFLDPLHCHSLTLDHDSQGLRIRLWLNEVSELLAWTLLAGPDAVVFGDEDTGVLPPAPLEKRGEKGEEEGHTL
jgi:hypothetical protein